MSRQPFVLHLMEQGGWCSSREYAWVVGGRRSQCNLISKMGAIIFRCKATALPVWPGILNQRQSKAHFNSGLIWREGGRSRLNRTPERRVLPSPCYGWIPWRRYFADWSPWVQIIQTLTSACKRQPVRHAVNDVLQTTEIPKYTLYRQTHKPALTDAHAYRYVKDFCLVPEKNINSECSLNHIKAAALFVATNVTWRSSCTS